MSGDLHEASTCYGLFDDEKIIGFCAVLHNPHPINKKIKRVHRLVILPNYQGIGLGTRFLNFVAKIYHDQGFDFMIMTSARNLIYSLNKSEHWCCIRVGRVPKIGDTSTIKEMRNTNRHNTISASFAYK